MHAVAEDLGEAAALALAAGIDVELPTGDAFAAPLAAARAADVAIVVVGDRAGLFGRGTVGEGNDVDDLELPGLQRLLVEEVVSTGVPTVMVVLSGRPYAIGWSIDGPTAPAAVVQAFFPGEEGATAIAAVLSGREAPSGRLPVSLPRSAGAQPYSYLHPILGGPSEITSADSAPALPFGHGLSYTAFEHSDLSAPAESETGADLAVTVEVRNVGERAGVDVVQLYARDTYASVTRPVAQLVAYARVPLEPGESALVRFDVPNGRLSFTDRTGSRVVEPGDVELWVGPSCQDRETSTTVRLVGPVHEITPSHARTVGVSIDEAARR
jgi:beta-glucosidase